MYIYIHFTLHLQTFTLWDITKIEIINTSVTSHRAFHVCVRMLQIYSQQLSNIQYHITNSSHQAGLWILRTYSSNY